MPSLYSSLPAGRDTAVMQSSSASVFSHGLAERVGAYVSLFDSLWHGLRLRSPDIVVSPTTPPLLYLGWQYRSCVVLNTLSGRSCAPEHCDSAIALGVLKSNGLSAGAFGRLAALPIRHADRGITLGDCMRPRLLLTAYRTRSSTPRRTGRIATPPGLQPPSVPT